MQPMHEIISREICLAMVREFFPVEWESNKSRSKIKMDAHKVGLYKTQKNSVDPFRYFVSKSRPHAYKHMSGHPNKKYNISKKERNLNVNKVLAFNAVKPTASWRGLRFLFIIERKIVSSKAIYQNTDRWMKTIDRPFKGSVSMPTIKAVFFLFCRLNRIRDWERIGQRAPRRTGVFQRERWKSAGGFRKRPFTTHGKKNEPTTKSWQSKEWKNFFFFDFGMYQREMGISTSLCWAHTSANVTNG